MLGELSLDNVGVIASASLELHPAFTVITGETGAGKTMLLTAIRLVTGGKADATVVRYGAERAVVSAVFDELSEAVVHEAESAGASLDDGGLIVVRTVATQGRSKALLGGCAVPQTIIGSIVGTMVNIHGQADQMRLRSGAQQRDVLDEFAGQAHLNQLAEYREAYRRQESIATAVQRLRGQGAEEAREAEMLRFGLNEIAAVDPQPGELDEVETRERRLASAEELREAAQSAYVALIGDDNADMNNPSVVNLLDAARRSCEAGGRHDEELANLGRRVAEIGYASADIGSELSRYLEDLSADPAELAKLQQRRADLHGLTRKYGPGVDDVLEWAAQAQERLADLDGGDEHIAELEKQLAEVTSEVTERAQHIHAERTAMAEKLTVAVSHELDGLAMGGVRFAVRVREIAEPGPHGADDVAFMLALHAGAPEQPVSKVASGGELSRIMLAIEVCLAAAKGPGHAHETLVFDEVDAGIGGSTALEVGRRLAELARTSQVVAVTHLAQVAAFADRQIVVEKNEEDEGAVTTVRMVEGDGRLHELARMMAGQADSESAQAHAQELLAFASKARS